MKIIDRLIVPRLARFVASLVGPVSADRQALFWQVLRYGVTGLFVTACQAAIYWTLAARAHLHPQVANGIGYGAAVVIGYLLHSAFTFRGHGERDGRATRGLRFVAVSVISYGLNAMWVWLAVTWMHWPEWTPIPAMILLTPAIVFGLNRQWVFR